MNRKEALMIGAAAIATACAPQRPRIPTPSPTQTRPSAIDRSPIPGILESRAGVFAEKIQKTEQSYTADSLTTFNGTLLINPNTLNDYIKANAIVYAFKYEQEMKRSIAHQQLIDVTDLSLHQRYLDTLKKAEERKDSLEVFAPGVTVNYTENKVYINLVSPVFTRDYAQTHEFLKKNNPTGNPLVTLKIYLNLGYLSLYPLRVMP